MAGLSTGNPWLSIWTSPRLTIAEIVRTNPSYRFLLLCFIYGFSIVLGAAQRMSLGENNSSLIIVLLSAVLGFFFGYISISVSSLLLQWTGRWLGGKGSYKNVRAAVAWSNVPIVVDIFLWLVLTIIYGQVVFTQDFAQATYLQMSGEAVVIMPHPHLMILIDIVRFVFGVWSLMIFFAGLSEVQGFSIGKAILNALLSMFVVIVVVSLVFMAIWGIQNLVK